MGKNIAKVTTTFLFCDGGSCKKRHSDLAVREARAHIRNNKLWDTTHTIKTRCNGRCEDAPTWIVQPGNFWYKNLTPQKAIDIVNAHTKTQNPIEEYLLYKNDSPQLNSNNERTPKPVVFNKKEDSEFGTVLIARASASDQYLYPVFKKLFEAPQNIKISTPTSTNNITEKHEVQYTDAFDMQIKGNQINITLAIGPITKAIEKEVSSEIKARKVGVAEVIWLKNNPNFIGVIRLNNRKGKHLISIYIPVDNTNIWEYIVSIYLNMDIKNPIIATPLET